MLPNPTQDAPVRNDLDFRSLLVERDNKIQAKGPSGVMVLTSHDQLRSILRSWEGK